MDPIVRVVSSFMIVILVSAWAYDAWADELQRPERGNRVKVFLLAGQSNMEGRADGNKLTAQDRERLAKVQGRTQLAFNDEPIRALDVVKPSAEIAEIYERDSIFGPELFFGITISEAWPQEKILIIKRSEGGTSLYGCWNPDWQADKAAVMGEENEPPLYRALTTYAKQVLSGYGENEYEICAMLWVQGESDAGNDTAAAEYGDNLRVLIERIRHDMECEALPFLLFQVGRGEVVKGMMRTAREVRNVTLIPQSLAPVSLDFYPKMENGHYNYEGMKKLGHRFAELFLSQHSKEHD